MTFCVEQILIFFDSVVVFPPVDILFRFVECQLLLLPCSCLVRRISDGMSKKSEGRLSALNQLLAIEMRLTRQKWLSADVLFAPLGLAIMPLIGGMFTLYRQSKHTQSPAGGT